MFVGGSVVGYFIEQTLGFSRKKTKSIFDNSAPCVYESVIAVPGGAPGWPFHRWA